MSAKSSHADATPGVDAVRDLPEREIRALTEPLVVVEDRGKVRDAPGLAHVYSRDGDRYLVDIRGGVCQCADSRFRDGVTCKHVRVARLWSNEYPKAIPEFVDERAVDRTTLRAARDGDGDAGSSTTARPTPRS